MKKSSPITSIFLTVFIDMLGVGIMIPIFAPLIVKNQIGIVPAYFDESQRHIIYGFLTATFSVFQFLGAPVWGALADQHGRKKILLFTIMGTAVGYLLFAAALLLKSLPLVFLARAVPGFMGGNIAIALAALADVSEEKDKTKNFGLIGMSFGMGFILGPAIGGLLATVDYSLPMWFTAALALLNWLLVRYQFPETFLPAVKRKVDFLAGFKNVRKAFTHKQLRVTLLVLFLMSFGFTFFTQFFQVFMIKKYNASEKLIAILFTYIGVWIAFTQGVITRIVSKKHSPEAILKFSLIGMAVAMLLIMFPDNYFWVFVFHPLLAIAQGLTQPNITAVISNTGTAENQGETLGMQSSVQSLAFSIPPIVAGFISAINYNLPILAGSSCIALSWLIFVLLYKK